VWPEDRGILGQWCREHGRHLEALKLMEECVQLQTRIWGNNHPNTLSSSKVLLKWQAEGLEMNSLVKEQDPEI
jgi:hypothetical protein